MFGILEDISYFSPLNDPYEETAEAICLRIAIVFIYFC